MSDIYTEMDFHGEIRRKIGRQVELMMLEHAERVEGHVPSNEEISVYGNCLMYPDGKVEWKWRGETVLIVTFEYDKDKMSWSHIIKSCKSEDQSHS